MKIPLQKQIILLIIILPLISTYSHDYSDNHTLQCTQLSSNISKL
jgi:hypothetical protein